MPEDKQPWYCDGSVILRIGVLIAVTAMTCMSKLDPLTAVAVLMGLYGGSLSSGGGGKRLLGAALVTGALGLGLTGCDPPDPIGLRITDAQEDCEIKAVAGGDTNTSLQALARVLGDDKTCSGVLIASDAILTARHCIDGSNLVDVWGARYAIINTYRHESADLAIIILDRPATDWLGKPIKPLQVYIGPIMEGDSVTLAGWGKRYSWDQDVKYPTSGSQIVAEVYDDEMHYHGLPGICDGDSGGPTLYGTCIVGVHRARIGECGDESIDVRLGPYGDWIRSML